MAKLYYQTINIKVSKMVRDGETCMDVLNEEAIEQLEAIIGELVTDKDHVLIEINADKN